MNLIFSGSAKVIGAVAVMALAAGTAFGQGNTTAASPATVTTAGGPVVRPSGNPSRDTLMKMQRPLTIELKETRLEDAIDYIAKSTGADLEVFWKSDRSEGLDKEAIITMNVKDLPAIALLEKVLNKALGDEGDEATWQMNEFGVMQVGRKKELNKFHRVELYDINDLLLVMPIFTEAPTVDLQQALQQSSGRGGGGGSQSPFKDQGGNQRQKDPAQKDKEREDRAINTIIPLITSLAEPTQWLTGGGDIPAPKYFQSNIIVDAPDYMHRALNGYRWWPSSSFRMGSAGRRYVSMSMDAGNAGNLTFDAHKITGGVP